jgi:hypothetical protein
MPPEFSKGDEEDEGVLHYFTRILLAIEGERKERNNHTTRVCNLSNLVETWPMRMNFLHRALDLFIAPNGKRDNYRREFKREK